MKRLPERRANGEKAVANEVKASLVSNAHYFAFLVLAFFVPWLAEWIGGTVGYIVWGVAFIVFAYVIYKWIKTII